MCPVEGEPTMEEIVGALRETRRGAGWAPPFTVVGGHSGDKRAAGTASRGGGGAAPAYGAAGGARSGMAGSTDIADLRDDDIERLLAENARLNERVVFLLKVIEREQAQNSVVAAEHAEIETDRGTILRDFQAAIETELRPVLLVMLRLIEKQHTDAADEDARRAGREAARPTAPEVMLHKADGIIDLDAQRF
jgi:hypothetical protein